MYAISPLSFDPELMFTAAGEQETAELTEQFTNHYYADRATTFAQFWEDGVLDGDEKDALVALWVEGESTIAYQKLDALMSSIIEQRVQHHLAHGTEPRGF